MSKAFEVIKAARLRHREETLARASDLSINQQTVIRELLDVHRFEQADFMIRRFKAGWSLEMIISESMSLIKMLEHIQTKLTGEDQ